MKNEDFIKYMENNAYIETNSDLHKKFFELSERARKITAKLNFKYHKQEKIRNIFSKLINKPIDKSFMMFPPFYTDCGINITVGKNVFINACCNFQDQGGIEIADYVLIGHNVVIATLNHDFNPKKRASMFSKKVVIKSNVWIGSNSTILPGVIINEGAIIAAGSIVTKEVPKNAVVAGNPAKIIKYIDTANC